MSDEAERLRARWPPSRRMKWILAGPVVILAAVAVLVLTGGRYESTDNAYVQVGKAPVSTSIDGQVSEVLVAENQYVRKGQPLLRIDARTLDTVVARAEAELAQARVEVATLRATYQQQAARVSAAREALAYAAREAQRQQALLKAGVASRQQADEAAHMAAQAREQLALATEQAAQARAALGGDPNLPTDQQARVLVARAALQHAILDRACGEVLARTDGVVTRVSQLQPGAYARKSQTLFWLLTGQPWVEANFKEGQLAHMKVGQPVTIKVDAYPGATLKGHVASFAPGTGAIFSALPAQNATGNWVKVTQRLPVQITFDRPPPEMAGRAGLSATVKVDVRAPGKAAGAHAAGA